MAEKKADFVLMGAGLTAIMLVSLSVAVNLVATLYFYLYFRQKPSGIAESAKVNIQQESEFRLPSLRFFPLLNLSHRFDDELQLLVETEKDPRRPGLAREYFTPKGRGRHQTVTRHFRLEDIFGLSRIEWAQSWDSLLRIEPVPHQASIALPLRQSTDDGYSHPSGQPIGELLEMRRYTSGDPVRHILWKVYARTRQLMVRTRERAIAPKPALVAYFISGKNDELNASSAMLFLEEGLLGADFVFFASGAQRPTSQKNEAIEQIIDSVHHKDDQGQGLSLLLKSVDSRKLLNLLIFAPIDDQDWVKRLLALSKQLPSPPTVFLSTDALYSGEDRMKKGWKGLLYEKDEATSKEKALKEISEALYYGGISCQIIDVKSGSVISPVLFMTEKVAS